MVYPANSISVGDFMVFSMTGAILDFSIKFLLFPDRENFVL